MSSDLRPPTPSDEAVDAYLFAALEQMDCEPSPHTAQGRADITRAGLQAAYAVDVAALLAERERLRAGLLEILEVPSSKGWRESFAIARRALAGGSPGADQ